MGRVRVQGVLCLCLCQGGEKRQHGAEILGLFEALPTL